MHLKTAASTTKGPWSPFAHECKGRKQLTKTILTVTSKRLSRRSAVEAFQQVSCERWAEVEGDASRPGFSAENKELHHRFRAKERPLMRADQKGKGERFRSRPDCQEVAQRGGNKGGGGGK